MIALLKYGTGMPFNREEKLQGNLGIPLPASTQWEIVDAQAEQLSRSSRNLFGRRPRATWFLTTIRRQDSGVDGGASPASGLGRGAFPRFTGRFGEEAARQNGQACLPRASSRPEKGTRSHCFLADASTRGRISKTCSSAHGGAAPADSNV